MQLTDYMLLFAGMGLVTYIPRLLPLLYLSHKRLSQWLVDWLSLIPVAILTALLTPILFANASPRTFDLTKPELLIAIPTFLVAWRTKSLGGTVIAGMLLYWLAGMLW